MDDLGSKVRAARHYFGYSQEFIADQLGVEQSNYSRMESGKRRISVERLHRLADIMRVDINTILNWDPSKTEGHTINANYNELIQKSGAAAMQDENEKLAKENAMLKELLASKDKIIALLEKKK